MITTRFIRGGCLAALLTLHGSLAWGGGPANNAFTYQGRLLLGGLPANGIYSFQFKLFTDPTNTSLPNPPSYLVDDVIVSDGLFTVQPRPPTAGLSNVFDGEPRWLEIGVRPPGGTEFTTLSPRQQITPTPYAIHAAQAGSLALTPVPGNPVASWTPSAVLATNGGNIAFVDQSQTWSGAQSFSGPVIFERPSGPTPSAPFAVLSSNKVDNLNANFLEGRSSDGFWKVGGNTSGGIPGGGCLGTLDHTPLDFIVGGIRALRLETGPAPPVPGRTNATPNFIAGSPSNSVSSGVQGASVLGGGGSDSTNFPALDSANLVTGDFGTVAGGAGNTASAYSFAAGHGAQALHPGCFVWADNSAVGIPASGPVHTTASNQFLIRASGGVGIGTTNPVTALDVQDGSGPNRQGGNIHVGSTATGGDSKLIHFGDLQSDGLGYVYVGEKGTDDTMELRAGRFHFNVGHVGIGTDNPGYKLHVFGTVAGSGPYVDASDARYKTNVVPLSRALAKILGLRGVGYDWRQAEHPDKNFADGRQIGFIAQEVKEVLPEVVTQDQEGFYSVAYSHVVPVLVEAIKEQQRQIEAQQTVINEMRSEQKRLSVLKSLDHDNDTAALSKRLAVLEKMIGARANNQ